MTTSILWFRNDLRLADNPALRDAVDGSERLLPVYIDDEPADQPWREGGAGRWWRHHSLAALDRSLRDLGSRLLILQGDSLSELGRLIAATGARRVCWNRRYEPALIERDRAIKAALKGQGIDCASHNGQLLREPWQLLNKSGKPYRVFTPFWRAAGAEVGAQAPRPAPGALPPLPVDAPDGLALERLELSPRIPWDQGLAETWTPGEAGAQARLRGFLDDYADYPEQRDLPATPGTSMLSPHLHFGELSPRQIAFAILGAAAAAPDTEGGGHSYLRQLGWREFAHHLLYHFPHTSDRPLDRRFEGFPWRDDAPALAAWQRGETGIPMVDAGQRQLWRTGWMHNRVRMLVASLLTKNLGLHWLDGARWFWDTLVDADLPNNSLGWQWTAGCGADAAPYFRIFNPSTQGQRFDPQGEYVRRWVPELARLPSKWIHQPWQAPAEQLRAAGVRLGENYPEPLVDLKETRRRALAAWDRIKTQR